MTTLQGEILSIKYVALDDAILWDRNKKIHDINAMIESIQRHGFRDAPIYDGTLDAIAAGNGRITALRAMREQGDDAPLGVATDSDGQWYAPIQFGIDARSREAAEAFAVDHNNLTMAGFEFEDVAAMWDDGYTDILRDLAQADELPTSIDLDDFDAYVLNMANDGEPVDAEPQTDRAEELREQWGVETGQLWQLGRHRLICGDCTDADVVARLMDGEQAVLCHADPPYGMGKEKDGIENDNLYREKLDAFQMKWWNACRPSLTDNASVYIWGNAEDLWRLWYVGSLRDSERMTLRNEIVWDKGNGQGMSADGFRSYPPATERALFFMLGEQGFNNNSDNYWDGWEPIRAYLKEQRDLMGWDNAKCKELAGHSPTSGCHWFDASQWMMPTEETYNAWRNAARGDGFKREYDELKREFYATRAYFDNGHDNMTDVWRFERVQGDERHGHATPKPVPLVARAIKSSSPDGSIALVPFGGTAPEIIACENLNRQCRAIEISPAYVAVALQRYADATGDTPELIE